MRVLIPGFFNLILLWISTSFLYGQFHIDQDVLKMGKIIPASNINSASNESSPILINDQIFFISDRDFGDFNIFTSSYEQGITGEVSKMNKKLNSSQHEGPVCKCNGKLYFSRSVRKVINGVKTDGLQLMMYANGKVVPLNTSKNLMHITCKGDAFYAVEIGANRTTNMVKIDSLGNILPDITLSLINSNTNDAFPNLIHDSIMVFASKRPGGYGGFDLYSSSMTNGLWSAPILLPPPFNTPFDDFGLTLFENGRSGLLSSNRPGGQGGDDVYFWATDRQIINLIKPIEYANFELKLIDKLTSEPIAGSYVKLYKVKDDKSLGTLKGLKIDNFESTDTIASTTIAYYVDPSPILLLSGDNGLVNATLQANQHFVVEILSSSHDRLFYLLTSDQWSKLKDLSLPLSPIDFQSPITEADKALSKDQIINQWIVRGVKITGSSISFSNDAQQLLINVLNELNKYQEGSVEIIAYSDAKGNEVQNLNKTQGLAKALKKWMEFKGIKGLQIEAIGGGDSKILNHCIKGVTCSTADHDFNNRIEISFRRKL
jgi:hypothetical protein